jgi:hypothetical protein
LGIRERIRNLNIINDFEIINEAEGVYKKRIGS